MQRTTNPIVRYGVALGLLILAALFLSGCSFTSETNSRHRNPPPNFLPEITQSPLVVREAYQFAVTNPEILKELPCYCGCGAMGHTSNYSCYVQSGEDEPLVFDVHAVGCSICVDITQDAMRLLRDGRSLADLQAYVDGRYAQYGPPTVK